MKILKMIVTNPYLNLLVGLILLYSGISESWYEIQEMNNVHFGVHHGVIVFSLMQILKTLPDIFEGMDFLTGAMEEE